MNRYPMMTRTALATLATGLFWSHSICHAVIVINADPNPPQNAPYVSESKVFGDMMAGMTVTAHFTHRPSETVPWIPTGVPEEGHATGSAGDWRLSQLGDTYDSSWTLEYLGQQHGFLTGLTLDGMANGLIGEQVVFDRNADHSGDTSGTPGSERGTDFTTDPNPYPYFDIHVTYKGEVAVNSASSAYGDIYRYLKIDFGDTGLDGNLLTNLVFLQDTDNLSKVPEPSTLAISALTIGILGARRRRVRRPMTGNLALRS